MSEFSVDHGDQRVALLGLYDTALLEVYGYLCIALRIRVDRGGPDVGDVPRRRRRRETDMIRELTVAWLIGVARNKLVDHWRRQRAREQGAAAPWATMPRPMPRSSGTCNSTRRSRTRSSASLGTHHRSVFTLRYLDGLPVREVAHHTGTDRGRHRGAVGAGPCRVPRDLRVRARRSRGGLTMTDPFEALRTPHQPYRPRPRLRAGSCAPSWSRSSVLAPMRSRSSTCPRGRPCPLLPSPPRPPPPLPQPSRPATRRC